MHKSMFRFTTLGVKTKRISSGGRAKLEVLVGEEVNDLLQEDDFRQEWETLYEACPWGTAFQSYTYVATWYEVYKDTYKPILIVSYNREGRLAGVLALAVDGQRLIVGAGAEQAEYQVWISRPEEEEEFVRSAMQELMEQFPGSNIRLKYVPDGANLNWTNRNSYWRRHSLVRSVKQPLMVIDEEKLSAELRKKNRREKMNRLKRLGHLNFERVNAAERFREVIDELTLQYDFRKGAMFNRTLFRTDSLRKRFLTLLYERDLLHTTLLTVDEKVIASNAGVMGKGWVHLQGLNTHCPTFAKHSPGILHFLLLGQLLAKEGVSVFDLTPGADPYKNILATDYGTAHQLDIVGGYSKVIRGLTMAMRQQLMQGAMAVGVRHETLRKLKKRFMQLQGRAGISKLNPVVDNGANQGQLILVSEPDMQQDTSIAIQYCSLKDLLDYVPDAGQTRWEFLESSMRRLEAGERCYTWSDKGMLLACGWVGTPQATLKVAYQEQVADGSILELTYYHTSAKEELPAFLRAVARQLQQDDPNPVYALVSGKDSATLSVQLTSEKSHYKL